MINIDTSDRREQRNFGLVMGAAIAVLGLVRYALHGFEHLPLYFFAVAAAFALLGLAAPPLLKPVFVVWIKLAEVLNWFMTRVLLSFAFFILITPTRFVIRFFGDDPLKRQWHAQAGSYWEAPEEQPRELERYKNQF